MYGMIRILKNAGKADKKEQGIGNYRLNHGHQFHLLNHHIHLVDVVLLMPGGPACVCEQKYHLQH